MHRHIEWATLPDRDEFQGKCIILVPPALQSTAWLLSLSRRIKQIVAKLVLLFLLGDYSRTASWFLLWFSRPLGTLGETKVE